MHTVLGVDLEPGFAVFFDNFVDAGRTIPLGRFVVGRQVLADRDGRIRQHQMTGLIFLVIGVGQEDGGQLVESEHAVGLGVVDLSALGRGLQGRVVGSRVLQGERQPTSEQGLIDPYEGGPRQGAEFVDRLLGISCRRQLRVQPGSVELLLEAG